jgi:cytochrome oxidase Cu insertion factor (SCO1/SenC/PrrC family)
MDKQPRSSAPRTQLVAILAIALASLGGAYLLFYLARDGGLWGTVNQGAFVNSPVTAADLAVRTGSGENFDPGGTWWLWVVPQGRCADACRDALQQLRQLHVLLNRDAARVRRALLTEAVSGSAGAAADLTRRFPRLELLSGNLAGLQRGIYVVDPIGNLVFHYPLEDTGAAVLDDLKRLLKVSQIG